jgi:hypothetical protein
MNDAVIEARLRQRLRLELESEPVPLGAWERVQQRVRHRDRARWMKFAAGGVTFLVLGVIAFPFLRDRFDRSATIVVGGGLAEGGSVRLIDPKGDESVPDLDLTQVELRIEGQKLQIAWTVAGEFGTRAGRPVTLKTAITSDGKTRIVAAEEVGKGRWRGWVAECKAVGEEVPVCPDHVLQITPPVAQGTTVTASVPLDLLGGLKGQFEWEAFSEFGRAQ